MIFTPLRKGQVNVQNGGGSEHSYPSVRGHIGSSGQCNTWLCDPGIHRDFCSIETNPDNEELRAESDITTSEGVNKVPLATTKFKEPTVGRQPVEIKGGLAELQRRGMKITSYSESNTKRKRDND